MALKIQSTLGAWMVGLNPSWTFQQVLKSLPQNDRAIFESNPELVEMFIMDLEETYRQGSRGSAQEGLLVYRPWGFELAEIRAKVYIWHGEKDQSAPIAMGRVLADSIPNSESTFLPNEGYFLGLKYWREIIDQLST